MMPPWLMERGSPGWRRGRSARSLGVVACAFAVAAAVVVSLCFVGGALASDLRRKTAEEAAAAAAGAHPGDDQAVATEVRAREPVYHRYGRRLLSGGPGSHPPRCTSKCGSCSPCYPVHVSVPPGVLVTTEYYPEAWRCKCRNQLYMP
ncbi:uncharacterized protein LOC120698367 [Panicum virgatum]|uniref:Epidermal patterning factor-like protein n=1 Tax=Panicum virgatum TaxID=38727 RepID=A0A8T0UX45_PANVG|nr:uncharacterized protein LOC120698367 [Panicum virgatum]KAG2626817.1 hypothetical protein PVAP13_3KG136497 [Panicum virgatum]